jgi:hypothetical protein
MELMMFQLNVDQMEARKDVFHEMSMCNEVDWVQEREIFQVSFL